MKLDSLGFEELDRVRIRLIILGGVVILIFSLLASRLWYLQISQGQKYKEFSQGNRIRLVPEPALREIFMTGTEFYWLKIDLHTNYT